MGGLGCWRECGGGGGGDVRGVNGRFGCPVTDDAILHSFPRVGGPSSLSHPARFLVAQICLCIGGQSCFSFIVENNCVHTYERAYLLLSVERCVVK